MCNCLKQIGEKLNQRLMEKVPEGSEVSKGFDTGWRGPSIAYLERERIIAQGDAFLSQIRREAERLIRSEAT
ncbi:hypothetical protein PEC302107_35930 [Pectobacterium araliae]|nr:hypothetical protein PEC302107_35930 [Pectobacterium carotovorum subsp. carotovorum]